MPQNTPLADRAASHLDGSLQEKPTFFTKRNKKAGQQFAHIRYFFLQNCGKLGLLGGKL
jgi:hypothetical protein